MSSIQSYTCLIQFEEIVELTGTRPLVARASPHLNIEHSEQNARTHGPRLRVSDIGSDEQFWNPHEP